MTKGNDNKSKKQLNDQILGIVLDRFYMGPNFISKSYFLREKKYVLLSNQIAT